MSDLKKTAVNKNRFPIVGYLFLIGTALFTALSYAFGRALDKNLDPESAMFFWFFGAFVFSIFVVLAVPSQRAEIDGQVRPYLMGWSPNSKMQETYNKRYNQEQAGKMLVARANKFTKGIANESEEN